MTETEWLEPQPDIHLMFNHLSELQPKASGRKTRLCMVAFCRAVWHLITDARSRHAIGVAERFADDPGLEGDVKAAAKVLPRRRDYSVPEKSAPEEAARCCTSRNWRFLLAELVRTPANLQLALGNGLGVTDPELVRSHAGLIRDVFGNPFRPISFSAEWRTSTTLSLGKAMYETRDFASMPVLSDALQDAGCGNEDILKHCRPDAPHVRGCWVVDLVLEQE
jgi:hypothetical protein